MRQGSNNGRRPRGRTNRKQHGGGPSRPHTFDSNGPDGRVRGNARQVYEKYLTLARDAQSSGDRVAAEAYFQYAEHYFRIMSDSTDPQRPERRQEERQPAPPADMQGEEAKVIQVNGESGGPGRPAKVEGEATEDKGNGLDAEASLQEAPADKTRSQDGTARSTAAKRRGRPRKPRPSESAVGEGENNSAGEAEAAPPASSGAVTSES